MNTYHQTFLLEYFRTGDKKQAYRKAYPNAKENCITNSVNRLLTRADIAAAIHEQEQTKRKDIEAEIAERYKAEIIDIYEAQATLIQVTPTISETLRALNTFFRLNDKVPPLKGAEEDVHPRREKNNNTKFPLQVAEGVLPPEPVRTYPHPFGNIYPKTYPGPYYDPGDPNTKEKMQHITTSVITSDNEAISQQPITTQQPATSPPFRGGVPAGRGGATQQKQSQMEVPPSKGAEGDVHSRSTTNNNLQQPATTPPFRGGVSNEERRGGDTQQEPTTHNNPQQNKLPPSGSRTATPSYAAKQRAWRIKLEQLRKEGWETANELLNEVHDVFINNQHSGTYKTLKQFEKAVQSRNLPVEEREKITQETGWEYHPEHPHVMRRKKRNL
jgi:hypothetical protein